MSKIEAHPDAAIFPMMSADELADLAADIKTNGQRFPIVIGKYEDREVIIDGRNRYEACEIAGVEPKFQQLNGHDPKAFILSVNVNRRHLSSMQRAVATAMLFPKGTQGKKTETSTETEKVHSSSLSEARALLAFSPGLAASVLAGTVAFETARKEMLLAQGKIKNETINLRQLRDTRPDLAERVVQGEVTLDAAIALEKSEAEAVKQRRWAATKNLVEGVQLLDRSLDTASDLLNEYDPAVAQQMGETITSARLMRVVAFATALAEQMERTSP